MPEGCGVTGYQAHEVSMLPRDEVAEQLARVGELALKTLELRFVNPGLRLNREPSDRDLQEPAFFGTMVLTITAALGLHAGFWGASFCGDAREDGKPNAGRFCHALRKGIIESGLTYEKAVRHALEQCAGESGKRAAAMLRAK